MEISKSIEKNPLPISCFLA